MSENHDDSVALASLFFSFSFFPLEHCDVGSYYLADGSHQAPINKMDV